MNAYDFDGTIYRGDSSADFYCYCLARAPWLALLWPIQLGAAALHALGFITKTRMKELFYLYFRFCGAARRVEPFWEKRLCRIESFYLAQRRPDDVVISASPEFLLRPACAALGVGALLASRVDAKSGRYTGQNCVGEEKVRRFRAAFPSGAIEGFWFDSNADLPLAALAREPHRVKRGKELPL